MIQIHRHSMLFEDYHPLLQTLKKFRLSKQLHLMLLSSRAKQQMKHQSCQKTKCLPLKPLILLLNQRMIQINQHPFQPRLQHYRLRYQQLLPDLVGDLPEYLLQLFQLNRHQRLQLLYRYLHQLLQKEQWMMLQEKNQISRLIFYCNHYQRAKDKRLVKRLNQ